MTIDNKEIFQRNHYPYYIWAPPYTVASSGIRTLHYLCNYLNRIGEEAYIITNSEADTNPLLHTPILSQQRYDAHRNAKREPIVVYPEIIKGNPIGGRSVVRYLLNVPGLFVEGVRENFGENDQIYYYDSTFLPEGMSGEQLYTPGIDTNRFNNLNNEYDNKRSGTLFYCHRYLNLGLPIAPFLETATEISGRHPIPYALLPDLYRKSQFFYSYERSAAATEATLCGCLVIYLESPLLPEPINPAMGGNLGVAWGMDRTEIERARRTLPLIGPFYNQQCLDFKWQLDRFISKTQWYTHLLCNS